MRTLLELVVVNSGETLMPGSSRRPNLDEVNNTVDGLLHGDGAQSLETFRRELQEILDLYDRNKSTEARAKMQEMLHLGSKNVSTKILLAALPELRSLLQIALQANGVHFYCLILGLLSGLTPKDEQGEGAAKEVQA